MILRIPRPRVRRQLEHVTSPTARGWPRGDGAWKRSGIGHHRDDKQDEIDHDEDGILQRRQDLARDQVLAGLGWTVIRVPAWRCLADAADTARQIADQLNGLPRRR